MMALGADWCNSARGFMFALGCIQSLSCHTDRCPTGVTTQDLLRERALVVPDKALRVQNFHRNVKRLIGLDPDASRADLLALCGDDRFDVDSLRVCLSAYNQWNGKKGTAGRVVIADWLSAAPAERLARLDELHAVLFTKTDTVRDFGPLEQRADHRAEHSVTLDDRGEDGVRNRRLVFGRGRDRTSPGPGSTGAGRCRPRSSLRCSSWPRPRACSAT